jgi:hypothetical protein
MRSSWSPGLVPNGVPDTSYLVVDCHGQRGCVWRETDIESADLDATIDALLRGEFSDPLCVTAFNVGEGWARDVTADIAAEIKRRCDRADEEIPTWLEDMVHQHVSPEQQLTLRLR